jgi:hypothetical protein
MEVCELHHRIQESLDQHNVFVGKTDQKLDGICKAIDQINYTTRDLNDIVSANRQGIYDLKITISDGVSKSQERYNERRSAEERVPGFAGSLNRAFNKIRDEFAFYLLMGGGLIGAWFLFQVIAHKIGWREFF